ncbi:MAG: alpha/beta hydrolase family protein [Pirellulaceae bacterium]
MRVDKSRWPVLSVLSVVLCSAVLAEGPVVRRQPCVVSDAQALEAWQQRARVTLAVLLNMDDQLAENRHDALGRSPIPLNTTVLETEEQGTFTRYLVEIDAREDRRIQVVLTIPDNAKAGRTPAVVCIHGHGGNRKVVYDAAGIYHGFAKILAENGYVTLSTNVGQHYVQDEAHRTLMGERLWDLIRVVDLAASREEVDSQRIGCAGLSLGGEMTMWLGAMDTRIAATVSSGFLTTMENLRHGHCMCWDFPGLQRRYEFADIYSLICPRALQCQNGKKERLPGGFPVNLAEQVMSEIKTAYRVAGQENSAELAVHPEGHVFDVPSGVRFLDTALKAN